MCNIPVSPQESINAPVDELVLTKSCLTFDLQGQTLAAKERLPSVATAWLDVNLWEFRHWSVGCSGVRHSTPRFADSLIRTQLQQIIIRSAFPVYEWPMRLREYAKTKTSMVGQHAAFHQNSPPNTNCNGSCHLSAWTQDQYMIEQEKRSHWVTLLPHWLIPF